MFIPSLLVPSYDHPVLWEGHSSMINEISKQLPEKPAAIFCSVGGGGLLGGVIIGCNNIGWEDGKYWLNRPFRSETDVEQFP